MHYRRTNRAHLQAYPIEWGSGGGGSLSFSCKRGEEVIWSGQQKLDGAGFLGADGVFWAHQDRQRGGCCAPTGATPAEQGHPVHHRPPPALLGQGGGRLSAGLTAPQEHRCHWEKVRQEGWRVASHHRNYTHLSDYSLVEHCLITWT